MRFLFRILPSSADRRSFLTTIKSVAGNLGVSVRNPKWTSYGALEIDVFANSDGDVRLFQTAIEPLGELEFLRDLGEPPKHLSPVEAVAEARGLFNAERYWESHEVLEGLWRVLEGDDKRFAQGVILVCAAFVHHQKGDDGVAFGVLRRADEQIAHRTAGFFGLDPAGLRKEVGSVLGTSTFVAFRI